MASFAGERANFNLFITKGLDLSFFLRSLVNDMQRRHVGCGVRAGRFLLLVGLVVIAITRRLKRAKQCVGCPMKLLRLMLLLALVLLPASLGLASTVDPTGILVGGGGSTPETSTSFSLNFTSCPAVPLSTGTGTGTLAETCFSAINESPAVWTNLEATITFNVTSGTLLPLPVNCRFTPTLSSATYSALFTGCSVLSTALNSAMTQETETVTILWFGGPGVSIFTPTVDPTTKVTWGTIGMPNATGSAIANVPEPGTVALFLTGIGALVMRRRFQRGLSS